eukprot:3896555-Prymnesium_polylepis.1
MVRSHEPLAMPNGARRPLGVRAPAWPSWRALKRHARAQPIGGGQGRMRAWHDPFASWRVSCLVRLS